MSVMLVRMDSLKVREAGFVHSKTPDEALDYIEMDVDDLIQVRAVSSKCMFIIRNGEHMRIEKEIAHDILICHAKDDVWEEYATLVEDAK
jgi:hypothetical protein